MSTKLGSKIITRGKMTKTTLPGARYGRKNPCGKMILYCSLADLKIVEEAIAAVTRADLGGIESVGTPNGRKVVAICRQWLFHAKGNK